MSWMDHFYDHFKGPIGDLENL